MGSLRVAGDWTDLSELLRRDRGARRAMTTGAPSMGLIKDQCAGERTHLCTL